MAVIKPFRFLPSIKRQEYNYEFADYVWYPKLFTAEEVEKIKTLWNPELVQEAKVNNVNKDIEREDLRKSEIIFIKPGETDWIYDRLANAVLQSNTNKYKFDITGFQTHLQIAKYSEGHFFDWHMDFGPGDISNRKISITVQLSDPEEYEGGDLQFMINQNTITAPKEKGTAILFPSFGLHRVTKVTKGERKSIVGWISGSPYR